MSLTELQNKIKILNEFMLTNDNMIKMLENKLQNMSEKIEIPNIEIKKTKVILPKVVETSPYLFPKEKDKLFWCFYIIKNGFSSYDLAFNKFTIEKECKIENIELLRKNSKSIKEIHNVSIKINEFENNLANDPFISLTSLHILILLHNLNVLVFDKNKKTYFEVYTSGDKPYFIVMKDGVQTGIRMDENQEECRKIRDNNYKIENIHKPLKCIGSYKVDELKEICEKLGIMVTNESGKKKTKLELYEEITHKI